MLIPLGSWTQAGCGSGPGPVYNRSAVFALTAVPDDGLKGGF